MAVRIDGCACHGKLVSHLAAVSANTSGSSKIVLMLVHRLQCWRNIEPAVWQNFVFTAEQTQDIEPMLDQCLVLAESGPCSDWKKWNTKWQLLHVTYSPAPPSWDQCWTVVCDVGPFLSRCYVNQLVYSLLPACLAQRHFIYSADWPFTTNSLLALINTRLWRDVGST